MKHFTTPATTSTSHQRKLALVLPAHNEEVVIAATVKSALAAGQDPQDIFVVSDGSVDKTILIALAHLPWYNVVARPQGGKAMAISTALDHFNIAERYEWVHIADADGVFTPTYFRELKARLSRKYVAATGHVQSLKGGWISKYRTYEYTLGLEFMRRIQSFFGVIPVIPGATCVFRTDILKDLDFSQPSLTEDMDLTLQIHRKKLGKIAYIPQAEAFTQDPKNFHDYYIQINRWYRGTWQVLMRHKFGRRAQKVDGYMGYMILEELVLLAELTIFPIIAWWGQNYGILALMFINDLIIFFLLTVWSAALNNRRDVIAAFPLYYLLRFVNLFVFFKSWFEIVVQKKFSAEQPGWTTAGRRYRIMNPAAVNH
jgi:cellulose synthase/poly-beta-1,6-N-acetylglucosamine synthase-like glycosyltransferase